MKKYYKFCITLFIVILCFITTLISVGFSALNKNLNIAGDIDYEGNGLTLYKVIKEEAQLGIYANEFIGDHRDSFTENPTKNIYYWEADDDTEATAILDKWNVIFGGFCWQMLRTTDTGGVKLIYNGTPTDGKCNNEGTAQQIGTSRFNTNNTSPADVGYMYNTRYTYNTKSATTNNVLIKKYVDDIVSNKYFGTGVTYSNGTYTLTGVQQKAWVNIYSSSSGLYTCNSTTDTQCSTVYYIAGGEGLYMYGFEMTDGNLLNYYNTNIALGSSYTKNNGTYTLSGTSTIQKSAWFNNYSTYNNYYTCGDNRTTCTDMKYIVGTYNYYYYALPSSLDNIYSRSFTYDSGTDTYTLGSDRYNAWEMTATNQTNLSTHHYTCFNQTGECQTLSYVYYVKTPEPSAFVLNTKYIYHINLTGGKGIEDALDEMFYGNNVNTTNSDIKTYIDNWYRDNMTSYTTYLEDTIFCNNRSSSNSSENGWNPNGGSVDTYMDFDFDSLKCTNDADKFSVINNKAKLTYPVGLASYKEMDLLNNKNLRKTGEYYWLGSPWRFNSYVPVGNYVNLEGGYYQVQIVYNYGVRPVVSLKPGTKYASGTGSKDDPYVVE